jgi:hypothetical protein
VSSPSARTASAVVSAMCTNGIAIASAIAVATLCIVFVHSTRSSAPARSNNEASAPSSAAARSHWAVRWSCSISLKSTDRSRQSAECKPPSRSRVSSLMNR